MVNIGDFCYTPYPPRGVVLVISIEQWGEPYAETAKVVMLHDHKGYPAFTIGNYPRHELTLIAEVTDLVYELITAAREQR